MIWQEDVSSIVMLTNLKEGDKVIYLRLSFKTIIINLVLLVGNWLVDIVIKADLLFLNYSIKTSLKMPCHNTGDAHF